MRECVNVKGHMEDAHCHSDFQRWCKKGNDRADQRAKEGALLHPQPRTEVIRDWAQQLRTGERVAILIAATCKLWPKAKVPKGSKPLQKARAEKVEPERVKHEWASCEGIWRCLNCLKMVTCERTMAKDGACPGTSAMLQRVLAGGRGHALFALEFGDFPLVACLRCGAYAASQARGLCTTCPGTAGRSAAGAEAVRRILSGRHPNTHITTRVAEWGMPVAVAASQARRQSLGEERVSAASFQEAAGPQAGEAAAKPTASDRLAALRARVRSRL